MSAEAEVSSCVRGYHVYKDRWAVAVGELFADVIATERSALDSDPLGSSSNGLKYWRRDILDSHLVTAADLSSTSHETSHR